MNHLRRAYIKLKKLSHLILLLKYVILNTSIMDFLFQWSHPLANKSHVAHVHIEYNDKIYMCVAHVRSYICQTTSIFHCVIIIM